MARNVRFPLDMNGTLVRTLDDLRDNFDLKSMLAYFEDGKLEKWLRDRFHDNEADSISKLDKADTELSKKLCDILEVEYSEDDDVDIEVIENLNSKKTELRKYTDDKELINNIDNVALTQDDLYDLLEDGKDKIYLVHGKFEIPTGKKNVTYIGIANPEIKVKDASILLDNGIRLENITLDISPEEYFNMAEKYFNKAMKYYTLAADKGYEPAKKALNRFNGESVNKNSRNIDSNYSSTGKNTDDSTQSQNEQHNKNLGQSDLNLGDKYYKEGDKRLAVEYYRKAAELGNAEAQYKLGHMYLNKDGVKIRYRVALKWIERSYEQGNLNACCDLAEMYSRGAPGVIEADYNEANQYFQQALEGCEKITEKDTAVAEVIYNIGRLYFYGLGVKRDTTEAKKWFRKADKMGHAEARFYI